MPFGSQIVPSYWEKTTFLRDRDVIVVGSGIVGLTAAIELKRKNPSWSILVIERGTLPSGASSKNAGFACIGSPSELLADARKMGWDAMVDLIEQRWKGLAALRQLVGDKGLRFESCGGFELFLPEQKNLYAECMDHLGGLNKALAFAGPLYFKSVDHSKSRVIKSFSHAIFSPYEGSIHAGMMMNSLLNICKDHGIEFLTGFNMEDIEESATNVCIRSGPMKISARLLLLATNAFTSSLISTLDVSPARNQVFVTNRIKNLPIKGTFHHDHGFIYFRHLDDRILIGGARNHFVQEESTKEFGNTAVIKDYLMAFLRKHVVPNTDFQIEHQWSGILGIGSNKSPITQWSSDRIFTACRLSGIGVAIGTSIGQAAARQILAR